jgi:hypothetical protein
MPMTIGDMRKLLRSLIIQQVPNSTLVMAKDAEGNDFSPLSAHSESIYWPQST